MGAVCSLQSYTPKLLRGVLLVDGLQLRITSSSMEADHYIQDFSDHHCTKSFMSTTHRSMPLESSTYTTNNEVLGRGHICAYDHVKHYFTL